MHGVSALIVDTIFSSDGDLPRPVGARRPPSRWCAARGGVFIADEVQPGFARTGDAMWGFLRHGVVPDLVTMGKPMGNGLPVAAMAAAPTSSTPFARGVPYFNTFGGNPVSMAAAAAVLDVIDARELMPTRPRRGGGTARRTAPGSTHPRIGDVRGAGLYVGVEIVTDPQTGAPDRAAAARAWSTRCGSAGC